MTCFEITDPMMGILKRTAGYPKNDRNIFTTEIDSDEFALCEQLVGQCLLRRESDHGGWSFYRLTDDGKATLEVRIELGDAESA